MATDERIIATKSRTEDFGSDEASRVSEPAEAGAVSEVSQVPEKRPRYPVTTMDTVASAKETKSRLREDPLPPKEDVWQDYLQMQVL